MAHIYGSFKAQALTSGGQLDVNEVFALLVDLEEYTFSSAHTSLANVPASARVATSNPLTAKTFVGGVFDAGDTNFSSVTGDVSEALILYASALGVANGTYLVAYLSGNGDVTGLPVTPNGGNIAVQWDAAGIFKS